MRISTRPRKSARVVRSPAAAGNEKSGAGGRAAGAGSGPSGGGGSGASGRPASQASASTAATRSTSPRRGIPIARGYASRGLGAELEHGSPLEEFEGLIPCRVERVEPDRNVSLGFAAADQEPERLNEKEAPDRERDPDEARCGERAGRQQAACKQQQFEEKRARRSPGVQETASAEADRDRCDFLASHLKHTTVVNCDAQRRADMEEERVGSADVFVACTGEDENNIMACVEARELGAKMTAALVSRPDYANVVGKLGIDETVSPREVVARQI